MKARFWRAVTKHNVESPATISAVNLARYSGSTQVHQLLKDEKFFDWFYNLDHNTALLEAGALSAIERLVEIVETEITEDNPGKMTVSTQVAAAKELLDKAGYGKQAAEDKSKADAEVADMGQEELLKQLAGRLGYTVVPPAKERLS